MQQYLDLLQHILKNGHEKEDRTGTGTLSVFGYQMRFNLQDGFPLLTTKKTHLKSIIYELLWFLNGDTNIRFLDEHGVRIWDDWPFEKYRQSGAYKNETLREFSERIAVDESFAQAWGNLGPVYGYQWRSWPNPDGTHTDQIKNVVEQIKNKPDSRRHIVSAWNPSFIDQMALPPCHCLFQFYVAGGRLSCQLYQRSADTFLGVPFNIASYALLTMMVAHVCALEVGEFIHTFGDVHLYKNHLEQAKTQLTRQPRSLPEMKINRKVKDIFSFRYEDFELLNYDPHPHIKAAVAV